MIVHGKAIADEILSEVASACKEMKERPTLTVFTCAPNFATGKFLNIKKRAAERVGVELKVVNLDPASTTGSVVEGIQNAVADTDGIIVQLPFPAQIDVEQVLGAIPASHDIDVIGAEASLRFAQSAPDGAQALPPVVGAIAEIAKRHEVMLRDKNALVLGRGRLVGAPAAVWLSKQGAEVRVIDKKTEDLESEVRAADVLVLGVGQPRIIKKEMLKEGVVVFDAGTSEDAGELVGDAEAACAEVTSLFTPVPGGIGPITVAIIFKNLLALCALQRAKAD